MKIAIITSGYMPVPASLGGAVECLDDFLINENEIQGKCKIIVFSSYEEKAEKIAQTLRNTDVIFIKTPKIVKVGDWFIYHIVKCLKPHSQTMSYRYILKRLFFINCVSKMLNSMDFDRVMIENHATLLMTMKKHKNYKKYEGKYIYHLHNEQKSLYGCEEVLANIKRVVTVSEYISSCICEKVPKLNKNSVKVWRNCVDNKRFGSAEAKRMAIKKRCELNIKEDEKVVLFTGRLSPEKGIKELLQAFAMVHSTKAKLVIAGGYLSGDSKVSNAYEDELKILAKKNKDRIIFTGFINYSEIPSLYEMANVVVIPSIWNDPAPLTVIETITSGVPLITTDSGGITEYANERCAIIIKRDNELVSNIATAIDKLVDDDALRRKMSEEALLISKNWTIAEYYNRFLECIQ